MSGSGLFARSAVAAVCAVAMQTSLPAQETSSAEASPVGTILIAHGATPDWNAHVQTLAHQAKTGGPVEVTFLMGRAAAERPFQAAAARLAEAGAREIVVVPLLVSSHSGHYEQVRYLAGATDSLSGEMLHHLCSSSGMAPTRRRTTRRGWPTCVTLPRMFDAGRGSGM